MPVRTSENVVILSEVVAVEEAEALHQMLLAQPDCSIQYEALEHLHAAVLQVLLAHGKALPEHFFLSHDVAFN